MVKQTKLSREIAALPVPKDLFFEWTKFGLIVLRKHWNELDFFRINKFMFLVRLLLENCFKKIEESGFKKSVFTQLNQTMTEAVLNEDSLGIF